MIHTTIGVYLSGEYKVNGVKSENIESHINYNKTTRFSRALLVDGKVVYRGSYQESDIPLLEEKFKDIKVEEDTTPYH